MSACPDPGATSAPPPGPQSGPQPGPRAEIDARCMARAVALARLGRPATAPNPCVGAVLADETGRILAEGWHERFGQPHAERNCLAQARERGVDPSQATLYVTLEPCNHHGKTPPCTDAVLAARIPRVVVGCADPNPAAQGGPDRLRAAGVEVVVGVLEDDCRELIEDFTLWKSSDLPFVTLKLAATLDGRIAPRLGRRQAVSGPASFADVQRLRAATQAVLVGGGTLTLDDPSLTRRAPTGKPADGQPDDHPDDQPLAVVVTGSLPGPDSDLTLLTRRADQTVLLTGEAAAASALTRPLTARGVRVWGLPAAPGGPDGPGRGLDLRAGLARLRADLGVHRVLCEGGGRLATSLLDAGLVHEFILYLAPRILGDDSATPLATGRACPDMAQALGFTIRRVSRSGEDLKIELRPRA
ncbi:MAG: bifunctional diaminohydroxyphosphoribosylaminopyrimidine deaminase/5-amino-6-(5-phosphoribosylamino)uracil reductase RibD [Desulfovibrionaceae bacterium]